MKVCNVDGCDRKHKARGLCLLHYRKEMRRLAPKRPKMPKVPCAVDGCDKNTRARGWCEPHYRRWKKYGDPLLVTKPRVDDSTAVVTNAKPPAKPTPTAASTYVMCGDCEALLAIVTTGDAIWAAIDHHRPHCNERKPA